MNSVNNTPAGAGNVVVARGILNSIEELIADARAKTRPLEVDPARRRLFELFASATEAGLIPDDATVPAFDGFDETAAEVDLSADNLCRLLARRSGLDMATREAQAMQTRLAPDQLEQMRLLWSVMRMWMEWTYAWKRWPDFHSPEHPSPAQT